MKNQLLSLSFFLLICTVTNGQIKIFEDNWISIGSLQKYGHGIQLEPCGTTYFTPNVYGDYSLMEISNSTGEWGKNWIVYWDDDHQFFVYGNGLIHTTRGIEIGSDSTLKTGIENITNPLAKVLQLHGVLFNYKEKINKNDTVRIMDKQGVL